MLCNKCFSELPENAYICPRCDGGSFFDSDLQGSERSVEPESGYSFGFSGSNKQESKVGAQAYFSQHHGEKAGLGLRFAGLVLDGLLNILTLGIGWFIWFIIVARFGQTPAKQILKMQVISNKTLKPGFGVTFWRYFTPTIFGYLLMPFSFLGFLSLPYSLSTALGIIQFLAFSLPLLDALLIFLPPRSRLVDIMFGTRVIRL